MEFSDSSRVKLFPVRIQPFGEDNFRVIRWGGKSKMLTRQFGVDAITLLKAGRMIGEVKQALAAKHGVNPSRVNLTPLLQALLGAQCIRRIDGRRVHSGRQLTFASVGWFLWRHYLSPFLRTFAAKFLPLGVSRRVGFWTHSIDLKRAMKPALEEAGRNLAAIWPDKASSEIAKLQTEFYRHWIWNIVDVEMLETGKVGRLDRWINRHISIHGIEHLNRARENKQGVILCVFHFSSTRTIPLSLMQRGYPVVAIGPANMGWGMNKTMGVLEKFKTQMPTYASLRLFGDFTLENLTALIEALKNREVATCMADVIPGPPSDQDAVTQERMRYFRLTGQQFPRAWATTNFLGQHLDMTAWVGWLAAVSGATVLPTMMLRKPNRGLELRIGPPVIEGSRPMGNGQDIKKAVNAALYHTLEQYVTEHPAQWFAWHNLHRVGLQHVGHPASAELVREKNQIVAVSS